jgi:sulfur carrier protein ThiS
MAFSIKVTNVDGNESSKTVADGAKLKDLLKTGQTGLVNGTSMKADTTLRANDHVEILRKSGKAGA